MKVLGSVALSETDNTSYAGFGRLTWNVTDQLRLTGAARYTYDKKKMDGLQNQVVGTCTIAGPPPACPNFRFLPGDIRDLNAALASIGFIRPGPAGTPYIDTLGTSGAIYTHNLTVINDSISNDKLTYRIAAEFEPRAGSLLYASRETGYRGGGYTFSSVKPVYDPENITAYTIGAKNRFFDNKLQFNVEAFYWKYKDQQVTHNSFGVTGAPEFVTENIGASTNKGVEFEIVGKPLRNTTLSANIQYLDAKNDSFVFTEIDNSFRANLPPGTVAPTVSGLSFRAICTKSIAPACVLFGHQNGQSTWVLSRSSIFQTACG
jgi:iron complex outermembrane recepter protein